ncbi:MAG: 50S ribosomal protein L21 [Solirubrobacterales bacterium]|nr:50S ribosomal protein L21 [Solirubrobacterales bacterium]
MYAIVKTGGKQYRVAEGDSLLVERLAADDGATVELTPLLLVDGDDVVDGDGLDGVAVQARVLGQERGPKLRVVKFKPKRGYKRRTGHRQELTRIEITSLGRSGGSGGARDARAATATEGVSDRAAPGATATEGVSDRAATGATATEGVSDGS